MYTQKLTLNDLHVDCFGRLKPAVMLWLIQEVSGIHAGHLGASWEALAEKNLFWAIIRHKVEVFRPAYTGQTITLRTWPMPTTRVAYPRATEAWDENGNLLFRSHAIWVLMDRNSRAMVLPGKSGVDVPGSLQGCEAHCKAPSGCGGGSPPPTSEAGTYPTPGLPPGPRKPSRQPPHRLPTQPSSGSRTLISPSKTPTSRPSGCWARARGGGVHMTRRLKKRPLSAVSMGPRG